LCTVDPAYWQALSDASQHSLKLQGGKMMPDEQAVFEAQDGWQTAVALRKRDDLGKQTSLQVPGLESYRDVVLQMLTARA
jgi:predicted HD phosphohydrolase